MLGRQGVVSFQLSDQLIREARHRRTLAVPSDDDVETGDQRLGSGSRGQQRQILAIFLPVRAEFDQEQVFDA